MTKQKAAAKKTGLKNLQDLTGQYFGKLKVIKRAENIECGGHMRVAWWVECQKCNDEYIYVARDLKRMKHDKGCRVCRFGVDKRPYRYKYARNVNGFIDKSKVIKIEVESKYNE